MELQDVSSFGVSVARAVVGNDQYVAAVLVRVRYSLSSNTALGPALPVAGLRGPVAPLSSGASVTMSATVCPVKGGDRFRRFRLAFGGRSTAAVAFGSRVWRERAGVLAPSPPEALAPLSISESNAFGGQYVEPPGEVSGLPHPGLTVDYAANRAGVGLYRDAREAEGKPLPSVELEDQLVRSPHDRPEPALFAPCSSVVASKLSVADDPRRDPVEAMLRQRHPAPKRHIVQKLDPGESIVVDGLSDRSMVTAIPPSPIEVSVLRKGSRIAIEGTLRWIHLDMDRMTKTCLYGHSFICHIDKLPRRIDCTDRSTA